MDTGLLFQYLMIVIVAILVGKVITEWYHDIKKRNRYMETQIRLLSQIAAASGVSEDKVAEIVAGAKLPESEAQKLMDAQQKKG